MPDQFAKLTESARHVLTQAQEEAALQVPRLGHDRRHQRHHHRPPDQHAEQDGEADDVGAEGGWSGAGDRAQARQGSTRILACRSGDASASNAPATPSTPTRPVISGVVGMRPSATYCSPRARAP